MMRSLILIAAALASSLAACATDPARPSELAEMTVRCQSAGGVLQPTGAFSARTASGYSCRSPIVPPPPQTYQPSVS